MSDGMDGRLWIGNAREDAASGRTFWINTYNQYDSASPLGGFKQSGFGRDLGYEAALDKYTQVKSVWVAMDR